MFSFSDDISVFRRLTDLEHLDLSYNRISSLECLADLGKSDTLPSISPIHVF